MSKMTAKQRRFCDEYLIDLNATQAAIRAGYSPKTAQVIAAENMTKPAIKEFIAQRMAEKESKLIADQDEVLRYWTSVMRGESQAEIVVIESTGDFSTKARRMMKAPDEKERLEASKQLGKRYGLLTEQIKADVDTELTIKIDYGDDEE